MIYGDIPTIRMNWLTYETIYVAERKQAKADLSAHTLLLPPHTLMQRQLQNICDDIIV